MAEEEEEAREEMEEAVEWDMVGGEKTGVGG